MEHIRVSGTSHPRANHAAGRGMPVLGEPQPRGDFFFWTVHCAAVGGCAAYGCGVPLAGAARLSPAQVPPHMRRLASDTRLRAQSFRQDRKERIPAPERAPFFMAFTSPAGPPGPA